MRETSIILPLSIARLGSIDATAKLMWAAILRYCTLHEGSEHPFWANVSRATLAKAVGITRRPAYAAIERLWLARLVEKDTVSGRKDVKGETDYLWLRDTEGRVLHGEYEGGVVLYIPRAIARVPVRELSSAAKIVYGYLQLVEQRRAKKIFERQLTSADALNMSVRSFQSALVELDRRNLLQYERRSTADVKLGRPNVLTIRRA